MLPRSSESPFVLISHSMDLQIQHLALTLQQELERPIATDLEKLCLGLRYLPNCSIPLSAIARQMNRASDAFLERIRDGQEVPDAERTKRALSIIRHQLALIINEQMAPAMKFITASPATSLS